MISFLKGKVLLKDNKGIILENQGIGFEVFMTSNDLEKISQDAEISIFTYLAISEKAMNLYGFLKKEEIELFKLLNHVSGIGPKTALSLSALGSIEELRVILEKGELPKEIKGVGKKKLQKIILELTGRIEEGGTKKDLKNDDAFKALAALGFSKEESKQALFQVEDIEDTGERVREALKILSKNA